MVDYINWKRHSASMSSWAGTSSYVKIDGSVRIDVTLTVNGAAPEHRTGTRSTWKFVTITIRDEAMSQPDAQPSHIVMGNIRGLASVLQAIKSSAKQVCGITLADDGLTVRWEEDSKTMQVTTPAPARLGCTVLGHTCGSMHALLDCLAS